MTDAKYRALLAEFTARPGNADIILDLLRDYADKVRHEAGNRTFSIHQVEGRPERFVVYEIYESQAAFETHLGAPYGSEFNRRLRSLIEEPHSVLTLLTPPS